MKSNSKVCFFLPSLNGGGAERITINLFNELNRRGIFVDLVVLDDQGPLKEFVEFEDKLRVIASTSLLSSFFKLSKYFKENDYLIFSVMTQPSLLILLIKSLLNRKLKIIVVEHSSFLNWTKLLGRYKFSLYKMLINKLYPQSLKVVTVSRNMISDFTSIVKNDSLDISCIYNPIDIDSIRTKSLVNVTDNNIIRNSNHKKLIFIGRLSKEKNIDMLLNAIASHNKTHDYQLYIIGRGEEEEYLRARVNELMLSQRVHFLGFQSNPYKYLKHADALILTSTVEGFPSVLVEAMSLGVPVISTDCHTGPSEIILDSSVGELVPVNDIESLTAAITTVLYRNNYSKNIVEQSANRFSLNKSVESYIQLINRFTK